MDIVILATTFKQAAHEMKKIADTLTTISLSEMAV
jgi:hypothetical protein